MSDAHERPYGDLSPEALFWDHTLLQQADKERMEAHCHACNYIALIEFDAQHDVWLWYGLIDVRTQRSWRKAIPLPPSPVFTRKQRERALTTAVVAKLHAHGIAVETEVPCDAGIVDIIHPLRDTIYEVKPLLTRQALFMAVGQLLLYREAINPQARLMIVGRYMPDLDKLLPMIHALGIRVHCWQEEM